MVKSVSTNLSGAHERAVPHLRASNMSSRILSSQQSYKGVASSLLLSDEKTKAQGGWVGCPQSNSSLLGNSNLCALAPVCDSVVIFLEFQNLSENPGGKNENSEQWSVKI